MSDANKEKELTLSDFNFLSAGMLRKLEIRFNSNTSEKLHAHVSFLIDHKHDDTEVSVFVHGKNFKDIMKKVYEWHENYYKNIKVFGKLTGRESEESSAINSGGTSV